jgi:hypothetical protein
VLAAVLLAGCLATSGPPKLLVSPAVDGPDPAVVPVAGTTSMLQIFTTASASGAIPTWSFDLSTGTPKSAPADALPTIPPWSDGARVWAPSVRRVAGRYLLLFSASPRGGGQNCIGAATASASGGPYAPVTTGTFAHGWCSGASNTAYLDPSLFVAADGTLWLYYSSQTYSGVTAGDIYVVPLSNNGLRVSAAPALVLTYSDVASNVATCGLGTFPRLENPSMVADPVDRFDLMMSLGSYNDPCYSTVEVPCGALNGSCIPGSGKVLPLGSSSSVVSTGGASVARDGSPQGNVIVFHGFVGAWNGTRFPYWERTKCAQSDGSACPAGGATAVPRLARPRRGPTIVVGPSDPTTTPDRYHEAAR